MKNLVLIVVALFSLNTFASFDEFITVFDKTVIADPWDEMTLEYEIYSQKDQDYNEVSRTVSHIMSDRFFDGLLGMKLVEVSNVDEALKEFDMTWSGFFCYRLVEDVEGDDGSLCTEKLRALLEAGFNQKGVSQIYVLKAEGDYYGDWETNFVIFENWDTKESLVVEFDIIHEI